LRIVPKQDGSTPQSAVVRTGGKQYRVSPGDRLLVDRLAAEAGTELSLGRTLAFADGDKLEVGRPDLPEVEVAVRVLGHPRGPKLEVLRYKSKKRVRVHRGARADLTAVQVLAIGVGALKKLHEPKPEAARKGPTKKAATRKETAAKAAQARTEKPAPRRAKPKQEPGDGA